MTGFFRIMIIKERTLQKGIYMNYEVLYRELMASEKQLADSAGQVQKACKAAVKDTEKGDLKDLSRQLQAALDSAKSQIAAIESLQAALDGFDTAAYFESGDFTSQMLEYAREKGVDVAGENPVFEMFPYKVRVDAAGQEVYLNRKKISSVRPSSVISQVATEQQRLNKASFNAQAFAAELESGYDLAVLKKGGSRRNPVILLNNIYKMMVPMARSKKEYDIMAFAFDIARLYNSGTRTSKSGRAFVLGTSRDGKTGIRILDTNGHEQFVSTLKFFDPEEE